MEEGDDPPQSSDNGQTPLTRQEVEAKELMRASYLLDFSLVKDLERPRVFTVLPQHLATQLARLPETSARAEASIHFNHRISALSALEGSAERTPISLREAYFRASLSEFCSMEEALRRDLALLDTSAALALITDLHNPLLHVMHELRHLNVHLTSSRLDRASRPAIWHLDGKDYEFDYEMWLVTNFDVAAFRALRNATMYKPGDIIALVEWFQNEQREWGADHLLFLAVCEYAKALISVYKLDG